MVDKNNSLNNINNLYNSKKFNISEKCFFVDIRHNINTLKNELSNTIKQNDYTIQNTNIDKSTYENDLEFINI